MKNINSAPYTIEWDYSPYVAWEDVKAAVAFDHRTEIGRNDSPNDVLKIPGSYSLSDGWLRFWLAVYRLRRWLRRP